jgi:hypothetical protein
MEQETLPYAAILLAFLVGALGIIGTLDLLPFITRKALTVVRETVEEIEHFRSWWRKRNRP